MTRGRPQTRAALSFARRFHRGQRRSTDGGPFVEHPLEVGLLLAGAGAPDHVIAAGLLHDVLEKTAVSRAELNQRFGARVATLVAAVSEDETIRGYVARKAALRQQAAAAGPEALTIFAADKVSKVHELRAAISDSVGRGEDFDESLLPARRLAHFRNTLGMLEERLGDSPLVELLKIELAGLCQDHRGSAKISRVG